MIVSDNCFGWHVDGKQIPIWGKLSFNCSNELDRNSINVPFSLADDTSSSTMVGKFNLARQYWPVKEESNFESP